MSALRQRARRRHRVLVGLLMLAGLVIGGRLVELQVLRHEPLAERARRNTERRAEIPGPRGDIVDRRAQLLGLSVPVRWLALVPKHVSREGLRALERATGEHGRLVPHAHREWREVTASCDRACEERVLRLVDEGLVPAHALYWEPAWQRHYPLGSLAAQTLGFVNTQDQAEGVEQRFDRLLRMPGRRVVFHADALERPIEVLPAARGDESELARLMLTIDARVQQVLEGALEDAMRRHGARAAQGIVLEPKTGEVLAMASLPSFDPNRYGLAERRRYRNAVIAGAYEPGSVIKPFVAAALLEHGHYAPEQLVYGEKGVWRQRHRTIRDVSPREWMTLPQALISSSNIGIVKFSRVLEAKELHTTLARLGFGRPSGIDLPAESAGLLHPPSSWKAMDKDTAAFGYFLAATPLQLALAYATVANEGLKPTPRVARAYSPEGEIWEPAPVEAPSRALSAKSARTLRGWLRRVVEDEEGTGKRARIEGHAVAGKTGTAFQTDPRTGRYDDERRVVSFAGFAPAEDARAVVVIVIEGPRREGRTGGAVAAPVFAEVMAETLRLLRVAPPDNPLDPSLLARDQRGGQG